MQRKEISQSEAWDFDTEPTLVGEYLGSREVETQYGTGLLHSFKRSDGTTVDCWGKAILNRLLASVPIGATVEVEKTGQLIPSKSGGNAAVEFKAWVLTE